jgi:hypothetical protein
MTGHDLLKQAGALVALLEAPEGADADALSSELAAWIDGTEDKLTAYWAVVKRMDAEGDQLRALEQTLAKRRRYLEAQAERVKGMASELLVAREALGEEPKVKAPLFSAWLAETVSVSISVEPQALPTEYQRVSIDADKPALKAACQAGAQIDGVDLVTRRGVRWR